MPSGPTFPAFLRLEHKPDGAAKAGFIAEVESITGPAKRPLDRFGTEAQRALAAPFATKPNAAGFLGGMEAVLADAKSEISRFNLDARKLLDQAVANPRTSGGALNLNADGIRAAAAAQSAKAAAARELANATEIAAQAEGRLDAATQRAVAGLRQEAAAQEQAAQASRTHAAAVDKIQGVLARQATASGAALTATKRLAGANDNSRYGVQNLGFQFQDLIVQIAGGTSAARAFAQQGPQIVGAVQQMSGTTGRFATFIGGPWGAAIGVGVAALGFLATKLFDTGDAATKSSKAHKDFVDVLGDTKSSIEEVTDAAREYADQAEKTRQTTLAQIVAEAGVIETNLRSAAAMREKLKAGLELVLQARTLPPGAGGEFSIPGGTAIVASSQAIEIRARIAAEAEKIAQLTRDSRAITIKGADAIATVNSDPAAKLKEGFAGLREEARKTITDVDKLAARLGELNKQERAATEALKDRSGQRRGSALSRTTSAQFGSPVAGGTITGRFGEGRSGRAHGGVDIAVPVGTAVRAVADGIVAFAGQRGDYGNLVEVNTGGASTRDAHLSRIIVAEGQRIAKGEIIGFSGGARGAAGAGNSKGPHLHHEVRVGGKPVNPFGRYAVDAGAVQDANAKAIDDAADARDRLVKASQAVLTGLQRETSLFGSSAVTIKLYEIAQAAAAAPTKELAAAITEQGNQLAALMIIEAARDKAVKDRAYLEDAFADASKQAGEEREKQLGREKERLDQIRASYQSLASTIARTGRTGRAVGGLLEGISTGNFGNVGGKAGATLGLLSNLRIANEKGDGFVKLGDRIAEIFETENGGFAKAMRSALEGAGLGIAGGGIVLGSKGSGLGSAVGGVLGKAAGDALGKTLGGLAGNLAGPLGAIAGGILGGLVGGLFKKAKTGTATLGFSGGELGVVGSSGNSGSRKQAASSLGDSITGSLSKIAEQLGGDLSGAISVSIGVRDKSIRVDPTGSGKTKKSAGAIDFGQDEAAAIKFAIVNAIQDGVITGLRASTLRLIQGGKDIEAQLAKAVSFEDAISRAKALGDPVGAAIDAIDREFTRLRKIFGEASASAEELASLEKLYGADRAKAVKEATEQITGSLKSFLSDLGVNNDALSLRERLGLAQSAYSPLASRVAAGDSSAYGDFTDAARALIDIQRQFSGSQEPYFKLLGEVRGLSQGELDRQTAQANAAINRDSPFSTSGIPNGENVVSAVNSQTADLGAKLDAVNANLGAMLLRTGTGGPLQFDYSPQNYF